MDLMARYEDNYFDLAIVDPPYGIDADKNAHKNGVNCKANGFAEYKLSEWDSNIPDANYFKDFSAGLADQSNINIEQGTIIKGATKSTYDTSETRYDKVYELPFGVESIDPRLMMFSGNSADCLRASVGLGRATGDTIVLGNIQKKTSGAVTFLNGLSIDGDSFHLINHSRTAKVDGTVNSLTLNGNGTTLTMGNTGASFNDDLDGRSA